MPCRRADLSSERSSLAGGTISRDSFQQFRKTNQRRESKMTGNITQTAKTILRLGGRQNDIPFAFYMLGG
jgi:hypothetical protein